MSMDLQNGRSPRSQIPWFAENFLLTMKKYLRTSCNAVPGTQYAKSRYTQIMRGEWPIWQSRTSFFETRSKNLWADARVICRDRYLSVVLPKEQGLPAQLRLCLRLSWQGHTRSLAILRDKVRLSWNAQRKGRFSVWLVGHDLIARGATSSRPCGRRR